jgi:hypothetical protein
LPVVINPESEYGKEMARWNKPWRFEKYPQCLYMARQSPTGKWTCQETDDGLFGGSFGAAERWTTGCQRTVRNDAEYEQAINEGWRDTAPQALAHRKALEDAVSTAAAEEKFRLQRMSEKAQAEYNKADAAAFEHLPEKPEEPIVKKPASAAQLAAMANARAAKEAKKTSPAA